MHSLSDDCILQTDHRMEPPYAALVVTCIAPQDDPKDLLTTGAPPPLFVAATDLAATDLATIACPCRQGPEEAAATAMAAWATVAIAASAAAAAKARATAAVTAELRSLRVGQADPKLRGRTAEETKGFTSKHSSF